MTALYEGRRRSAAPAAEARQTLATIRSVPHARIRRVKNFLIRVLVNGIALWVSAVVVPGVALAEGNASLGSKVLTIILVALVFGVVNAVVKPIAKVLSFPAIVLTIGLFTFVVNAFMLQITEWLSGPLGLSFSIDSFFWDAVLAAVVITFVSWVLNLVLPDDEDD